MSINKDNFDNHDLDIFDDDFEVIYEGDLPDIPMPEDDNFQDVLSNLSDLDRTKTLITWRKTTQLLLTWMRKQKKNMKRHPKRKRKKYAESF